MSDVRKMGTREGYGQALLELGKEHEDIVVLDADLAGSTKTGVFQKAFPERHINCGIAEGNMMWQQVLQPQGKFRLQVHLQCLPQDVRLSRYAILSAIRG